MALTPNSPEWNSSGRDHSDGVIPWDVGFPWDYGETLSNAMANLPPASGEGKGEYLPGRGGDEVSIEELWDPDDHRPGGSGSSGGGSEGGGNDDGKGWGGKFPLHPSEYNYFDLDGKPVWQQGKMMPQLHNGKEWVTVGLGKILMEGKKIDKAEFDRLVAAAGE